MADSQRRQPSHYSPLDPKRVANTTDVMVRAANLRAAGSTFREIGETLGIDHSWARELVMRALEQATYEAADVMRTQEGIRLDRLQRGLWAQAVSGDVKAATAVVRIMERRAKLFGLDAPVRIAMESEVDAQIAALAESLAFTVPGTVLADDTPEPA